MTDYLWAITSILNKAMDGKLLIFRYHTGLISGSSFIGGLGSFEHPIYAIIRNEFSECVNSGNSKVDLIVPARGFEYSIIFDDKILCSIVTGDVPASMGKLQNRRDIVAIEYETPVVDAARILDYIRA